MSAPIIGAIILHFAVTGFLACIGMGLGNTDLGLKIGLPLGIIIAAYAYYSGALNPRGRK